MELCPHKANPRACPLCYHKKPAAPKEQPRQFIGQQTPRGKVVAQNNPVIDALSQRKLAAIDKMLGDPKLATARASAAAAQPVPVKVRPAASVMSPTIVQDVNPHEMPSMPQSEGEPEGELDVATLERMFPKHASIIDRQPVHPEANHTPTNIRGGGRAPVTKGKPVGS